MNGLWCVVIGDPPWCFGPFPTAEAADEWRENNGGDVWPLWHPTRDEPRETATMRLRQREA